MDGNLDDGAPDRAVTTATGWAGMPEGWVPSEFEINVIERAWVIIANAGNGGDWEGNERPDWIVAAELFRDEVWHPALARFLAVSDPRVSS